MAMDVYTIVSYLREPFNEKARSERFEVNKLLFRSKMVEGTSPVQHVPKIKGYIEMLISWVCGCTVS